MKFCRLVALAFSIIVIAAACSGEEQQALTQNEIVEVLLADGVDEDIVSCAAGTYKDDSFDPILVVDLDEVQRFVTRCEESAEALIALRERSQEASELAFVDDQPFSFGDDPALDLLWSECEQGEGNSCDELFDVSALGSEYEQFGLTCGNRDTVLDCEDLNDPESLQPVPQIAVPQVIEIEEDAADEDSGDQDADTEEAIQAQSGADQPVAQAAGAQTTIPAQ